MQKFSTLTYVNAEEAGGTPQPLDIVTYVANEGDTPAQWKIVNDGRWPIIIGEWDIIFRDVFALTFVSKG